MLTFKSGILASAKVPLVTLLAPRLGILASSNVPDVTLLAPRLGIRASSKVPPVTLLAFKAGISLSTISPLIVADDLFSALPKPTSALAKAKSVFKSETGLVETTPASSTNKLPEDPLDGCLVAPPAVCAVILPLVTMLPSSSTLKIVLPSPFVILKE